MDREAYERALAEVDADYRYKMESIRRQAVRSGNNRVVEVNGPRYRADRDEAIRKLTVEYQTAQAQQMQEQIAASLRIPEQVAEAAHASGLAFQGPTPEQQAAEQRAREQREEQQRAQRAAQRAARIEQAESMWHAQIQDVLNQKIELGDAWGQHDEDYLAQVVRESKQDIEKLKAKD